MNPTIYLVPEIIYYEGKKLIHISGYISKRNICRDKHGHQYGEILYEEVKEDRNFGERGKCQKWQMDSEYSANVSEKIKR